MIHTFKSIRVPHDARSWAGIDARWREGFLAGLRIAVSDAPSIRLLGHGGEVLEELSPGGSVVAPRQREGGSPA